MSDQQPAGWYYAQGDPPGTMRYWDGNAWQGGPQAAQDTQSPAPFQMEAPQAAMVGSRAKAGIGSRFVANLLDGLVIAAVGIVPMIPDIAAGENASGIFFLLGFLAYMAFAIWNLIIRLGKTGQSLGKQWMSVTVLDVAQQSPIGAGRAFARLLLGSIVNTFLYIGYIWALFDKDNQRLTDKMINANVYKT